MAMSRRDLIEMGVSYGSGIIACGNDEIAYIEALRAFPEDASFAAFKQALRDAEVMLEERAEKLAAERAAAEAEAAEQAAAEAEAAEQAAAETEAGAEPAAEAETGEAAEPPVSVEPREPVVPEEETGAQSQEAPAEAGPSADELASTSVNGGGEPGADALPDAEGGQLPEDVDDGLDDVREATRELQRALSHLAMSELYLRASGFLEALNAGALPPVAEIEEFEERYEQVKAYCATH